MAELIKRQFDLLAFTVSLDLATAEAPVICLLEGSTEGTVNTLRQWRCSAAAFGLPTILEARHTRAQGHAFRFPQWLLAECAAALREEFNPGEALWLHLRQPIGYLDMLPWERFMQPMLGVPILRLPEFVVDPPQTSPEMLNIVLCCSTPAAKEAFAALPTLLGIAQQMLAILPDHTQIDIFTDQAIFTELQDAIAGNVHLRDHIHLHNPVTATPYTLPDPTSRIRDPMGRLENPWLLWMRDALQGRAIDIVHCLTHGYYAQEQGAIALSESPLVNRDERISRFVGAAELSLFLTQVGAWAVAFSSPANNYSEMGLRRLTHTIAQMRPGPVIHHDLPADPDYVALTQTYGFLFGGQTIPPASPTISTYCHPSRLQQGADLTKDLTFAPLSGELLGVTELATRGITRSVEPIAESVQAVRDDAPTNELYTSTAAPPGWAVAAERYIEQRTLELAKQAAEPRRAVPADETAVTLETLRQIQDIVASNVQTLAGTE